MKIVLGALLALVSLSAPACAGETDPATFVPYSSWQVVPVVGTLGVGLEGQWQANDQLRVRLSAQAGRFSFTSHQRTADLVNTATLMNAGLFADWRPWDSGFFVTGGVIASATTINGTVRNLKDRVKAFGSTGVVTVEDPLTTYHVTQNPFQPFAGIGYSRQVSDRLTIDLTAGAAYAGVPDLGVVSHARKLGFTREQIDREIRKAERQAAQYQVVPVVRFGFNFKF